MNSFIFECILIFILSDAMLKCGLHKCTSSCHQLSDHSRFLCRSVMNKKCDKGHSQSWQCHAGAPPACSKCEREKKEAMKKAQRALEEKEKKDERSRKHLEEVARYDEEMERIAQSARDARLDDEQKAVLAQKQIDLAAAKERANRAQNLPEDDPIATSNHQHSRPPTLPIRSSFKTTPAPKKSTQAQLSNLREHIKTAVKHNESPSMTEWQRQKDQENAQNPAIDKIMLMIGLEQVKSQILRIKAKIDTSIRQGTDLSKERLGLVLLGNPGTGMFIIEIFDDYSDHAKAKQRWQGIMQSF